MPLRCTRQILSLIAVLLIACAMPTAGAASGDTALRVSLETPYAAGASAHRINIDGTAPVGCVPRLARVTRDGADVNIELSAPVTGCKPQRRVPFHLQADPSFAAGGLPADVYRLRIYSGSGANTRLAAFALIDTSAVSAAPIPESGFWWTQASADAAAAAGTGMSLELQENQLAASLLGFTDTGASTWYFGSATLGGRVARIPLVQLGNGEEWFSALGSQPDVQPGPRLDIEFLSPTRARGYLVRTDSSGSVQVRPLTLARSAFSSGPAGSSWVGRWVLVPEDGGGTRLFDFTGPSNRDAERFRLVDTANDAVLDCRLIAGTQQADACTLTAGAAAVADFDQVGYEHISGHGANGAPVQLVRVPR